MYTAGVGGFFDAAAAHPYVSPTGIAADPVNGWSDVGRMHDVMVTHGDGDKKIWLTELGAATSDSPEGVSQPSRPDKSPMCWPQLQPPTTADQPSFTASAMTTL